MMKILQINVDYDSGGPGTIEKDIYDSLIAGGHQCKIVYSRGKYTDDKDLIRIGNSFDVKVHTFFSRVTGLEGYYSRTATKEIIKRIREYDPDIVQLHNLMGHYINFPLLFDFLGQFSKPVVWTIHDCSPFTGHCISFDRISCDKWKRQCDHCPFYKEYPYSYFFDTSRKVYNDKKKWYGKLKKCHLVVPSNWMHRILEASMLGDKPIITINNGINIDQYKPMESNLREQYDLQGKTILLSVANVWNEMKGIKKLKELSDILPDTYALVIIGRDIENEGIRNAVLIPPTNDKQLLAQWYSTADLFINPTLGDNYPTVNIEALSCGTPIITFNTGGSPEIAGNECGRVVEPRTAEALLNAIENFKIRDNMIDKCRERAAMFDRSQAYKKYVELYESLL